MSNTLFDTVTDDHMELFNGDSANFQKLKDVLKFRMVDIAKGAGVPLSAVRQDERMSSELTQSLREWAMLINLISKQFGGDEKKTILWLTLPNPMFGNIAPRDMIRYGRFKKLSKYVMDALEFDSED